MTYRSTTRWLLGLALVASGFGCMASAERDHLLVEVSRAKQDSAASQHRVARLEQRLARLEQGALVAREQQRALARVEALVAENQRLLVVSRAQLRAVEEAATADAWPAGTPRTCVDSSLAPMDQLRLVAEQLHSQDHWRGGLSREQSEALYLLLRGVRSLDAENPWRARADP